MTYAGVLEQNALSNSKMGKVMDAYCTASDEIFGLNSKRKLDEKYINKLLNILAGHE